LGGRCNARPNPLELAALAQLPRQRGVELADSTFHDQVPPMTYELKRSVLQLKTKTKPHSFALYTGASGDQILITPKKASPRDLALIAGIVGDTPERRCRGVCQFKDEALLFKTKTKWNAVLESAMVKVLRREGLGKFVPPAFVNAAEGEALDDEVAANGAQAPADERAVSERIERLSGGNPRLTKLADELLAEVKTLKAQGRLAEAAEKEAYLQKVVNALVRTPEAVREAKVDPAAVVATSAAAARMPHPRGNGGAVDYPSEDDFYSAFGQFESKFKAWVRLVEKGQPKLFDAQAEVDSARAQYADRLAKGEQALRAGMKRDLPAKLRALNKSHPQLNQMVQDTALMPADESSTSHLVDSAQARVSAALKGVAAAALEIHILELKDTIDDLEARRKSLQATIDRNVGLAEKFLSTALKGPVAIKAMLIDEAQGAALKLASTVLAGVFSAKEQAELEKVNRKLDAEKRKLKEAERNVLTTRLEQAKATLDAETKALYAASDNAWKARHRTENSFKQIATLSANGGVPLFQELRQYRSDMQMLWSRYAEASSDLVVLLRLGPLAAAYAAANERIKTIKEAREQHFKAGGEKTDEDALILSDMSAHYKRFADWYFGEFQKYKTVGRQLAKAEHTELIAEVLREADKAMNP
jgi:hypothetical protein